MKPKKQPNILLIVMDAARAKNLSCYGYERPTTPNLEQFAERSVIYETAISPAGWSLPSHASIFTGLYPSRHGAHDQHKYLVPEHLTMAEILRDRGYHTLSLCYNAYVGSTTGLNRGFERFNPVDQSLPRPLRKIRHKIQGGIAALKGLRDSGARFVNQRVKAEIQRAQKDERPFFTFVHYMEPHAPYRPPRRYNLFLPDGVSRQQAGQINQDRWQYFADPNSMSQRDFEILTALYDGELAYLDARLAELLHWLEKKEILDQTMVIITSDHGENIGDHQMVGHTYCLYDTLVHVPLIIHYPVGTTPPGRIKDQVQTVDLLPTILAMMGDTSSEIYRSLQGYDLLSTTKREFTIAEQTKPDLSKFYERFPGVDVSRYDRALKMIRTDRHKYIWASDGNHELYDLRADPDEQVNVINEHPDITTDLDRRLTEWRNSFEAATPQDEVPEFDQAVKERLRALGYLE